MKTTAEIDIESLAIEAIERIREFFGGRGQTLFIMADRKENILLYCTNEEHVAFIERFRAKLKKREAK